MRSFLLNVKLFTGIVVLVVALITASSGALAEGGLKGTKVTESSDVAVGDSATVGDYEVMVLDFTPNADDLVAAENQLNDPPLAGNQFAMVRVGVTYNGDEKGKPWSDLSFRSVGALNVGYTDFNNSCGVIPDRATSSGELFEGGSVEFNICWQIATSDASSLSMYVKPSSSFDAEPTWFSLGNSPVSETPAAIDTLDIAPSSSRTETIAIGTAGQVTDYVVSVNEVVPMADELIASVNSFNDPPVAGNQFFMVNVSVTYTGSEAGIPWMDLKFKAVGDSSVGYTEASNSCGVTPEDSMNVNDVFPGGSVSFNVCWQIASADANSLVMYIEPLLNSGGSDPAWFNLQP